MSGRNLDPMNVDANRLSEAELRIYFEVLREKFRNLDETCKSLKKKPRGRTLLRVFIAAAASLLMLFSGLLYTYAITKLTATKPDLGAETLLTYAIVIYAIAVILQVTNAGVN